MEAKRLCFEDICQSDLQRAHYATGSIASELLGVVRAEKMRYRPSALRSTRTREADLRRIVNLDL
jgi:hypothetical protein